MKKKLKWYNKNGGGGVVLEIWSQILWLRGKQEDGMT
jgi:hypothetical protein